MLRTLSLGFLLAVSACGSAQYIQRTQTGGTIELDGDRTKAMEQANGMMAQHCGPNNFAIVQEGLEPVGTDTFTQQDTSATAHESRTGRTQHANEQTTGVTSTRTATAWRVHYQCNAPGGEPPMGAPPPAAPAAAPTEPPPPANPPPPGY
jgi:hypothetical protein